MVRKAGQGQEEEESRARQQRGEKPARHEEDKMYQLPDPSSESELTSSTSYMVNYNSVLPESPKILM
ncbi:hypothetical protein STEG23_033140 [Scotinomys teguina]